MLAVRGTARTATLLIRTGASPSPTATSKALRVQPRRAPPPPIVSRWRHFLQTVGRVTLITIVAGTGTFYYLAYKDRTPGPQLPFDPEKKTLVVLGTGWGATSLLKSMDTTDYNVIVVSPKNFFLFTPLLPSVAVGTLNPKSIIQPIRHITRHKQRTVNFIEAEAQEVDPFKKTVTLSDLSGVKGEVSTTTINYDYLVYAVGAETQTFNIPGVKEHACFMKELHDAEKAQDRFIDCIESAAFPGQTEAEKDRLLHMIVVGGGPTGVELSGELHDFLVEDLRNWYPDLAPRMKISLIEALPSVLPTFSKQLIDYTVSTFKEANIDVLTKTMVKEIRERSVVVKTPEGTDEEIPCGVVVWAGGNKPRKVSTDLMAKFPEAQTNRNHEPASATREILRGGGGGGGGGGGIEGKGKEEGATKDAPSTTIPRYLDQLRMKGTDGIFAIGDCTSTSYAPTAQVASQEGAYLARVLAQVAKRDQALAELQKLEATATAPEAEKEKEKLKRQAEKLEKIRPFHYSHQGSLAYIGSDRAIADLSVWQRTFSSGGAWTYLFWRSVYLSTLFSLRNRTLVATDWLKVKLFGRDVSRE
ncbi:NADH dehydrogenase [Punctularia strigosozonata HHB-11173 SS5]|uniref:NADH dehydrogenase n=1 Tax=Punctularia strigosozonata (strain HHB-11173) TaxID=741275 RepID=UPI0004417612|nr:NADH dehydrogenase [Punctularia strigosozonata HHB-11173 SS5]EIN05487.1 NADH dehydrogenase [Punctularia strigosozonata HHB-11173 SS5]